MLVLASFGASAQVKTPQLSPLAKFEQTVGLTTINMEYSRPSARGRAVFPDVVPYDEIWRTGANKNAIFTASDHLIFGNDTLKAGTYSLFAKPSKDSWTVYFYTSIENWGTPDKWEDEKVALKVSGKVNKISKTETFTISIDQIGIDGATLSFAWDAVSVQIPFTLMTDVRVEASIKQTLGGPTANDYYRSADYYYNSKKDMKTALEWINKSLDMQKDPAFYMLRKKSLIQAELKDFKGAIDTAKIALEKAKTAGNEDYIKMNEDSISEWSKK